MAEIALVELEDFALELAHTAGGIAHAHFRQPITVENKSLSAFDPVTNADRAIERVLRTAIDRPLSGPWHRRRGRGRTCRRRRVHVVHRSDRRHARVHDRLAALGHLDRTLAARAAAVWLVGAACARGSVFRRPERELAHQSRAPRSAEEPRLQDARRPPCSRALIPTCSRASVPPRFAPWPSNAC